MSAARSGEEIEAAKYVGQIDILETILDVPKKYLDEE